MTLLKMMIDEGKGRFLGDLFKVSNRVGSGYRLEFDELRIG